ncbi:Short-chain dehydrogenase/reductase family 16C member-like protein [Hapsidospora chrysogenum ATCC 11550]|uniref:Short-chain dehydrogenase/reductase 3 n=1 Tax=Hapsidospora chrysogenum (strain ATCC 11550 / CBS 779.69 / DSM 880 / IAM 14645 / JCM 23072 / IMI 49137) TaxID=857340 RepID=A0A086T4E9_HAPC1|nr:Short-chain dehydrogenase/reductase family 16C member-like protein [Hapsidospora chrysogenum ATCC 11550]
MSTAIIYSSGGDFIGALARIALSPLVSGPLLLAATYAPKETKEALSTIASRIPAALSTCSPGDLSTTKTILKVLVALGIIRVINKTLNNMAQNSWRLFRAGGWDWNKEIAVVTGGCSGIGLCVVERLVAMGVRVAVLDIQDLPKQFQNDNRIRFYHCDVTSADSVAQAAHKIRTELGHPSVLINNAGVTYPMPILRMPEKTLRTVFGVNCMSHWYTVQQFLPRMIQLDHGHVVTVASLASFVALPTGADYAATKAGALAFHEALAQEVKHHYKSPNILTTVVHPDFVATPLLKDIQGRLEKAGVKMLTPDVIADGIVAQLKERRGGQVIIPKRASIASGVRGWPHWLQELLRDVIGRASTMQ